MYEMTINNSFSVLSTQNTTTRSLPSVSESFSPQMCSSPKSPNQDSTRTNSTSTGSESSRSKSKFELEKQSNFRTMIVNCQSLRGKIASFQTAIEYIKPDVILGSESWLDGTINNSEIFPTNYNVIRKDRNLNGGGVFIATKDCYNVTEVPEGDTEGEIKWARIELEASQDMYVCSYYRPPNNNLDSFKQFGESLNKLPVGAKKKPIIIEGDFNLPDINWKEDYLKPGSNKTSMCEELLSVAANESLTQIQEEPTREGNVLDLCLTNRPGLVKHTQTVPGIADHSIVVVDSDLLKEQESTRLNLAK